MLHYFAHDFFAPVLPVSFEDDDVLYIYAISDLSQDLTLWAVVGCPHIYITDLLQQKPGGKTDPNRLSKVQSPDSDLAHPSS